MILNNVKLLNDNDPVSIIIKGSKIEALDAHARRSDEAFQLDLNGAVAFPGLINSHDHLDFNCFPQLGDRNYQNYTEWGKHIHERYSADIEAVLKIPEGLRATWGMYKNLLAGVTTVVNHGAVLNIKNPLVNIEKTSQSLHSVAFEKNWKQKLNNPLLKNKICVIHAGEGVDEGSSKEIDQLLQWNLLKRKLIAVHGVAMNIEQAKKINALVWCPVSNQFLLNRHADIEHLKQHTKLLFGTDSTLTADWNIWHHLRAARETALVTDAELFETLTRTPANIWGYNCGEISKHKDADIVVARTGNNWDDLYGIDPENILLVIQQGVIRMFDAALLPQFDQMHFDTSTFSLVNMNGHVKFVAGDLPAVMAAIKMYYPKADFPCTVYAKTKITADA